MSALLALLQAYAYVIVPCLTALLGWLVPSPLQKATKAPQEVKDAEDKADAGDPSDLDHP